ncbi:MAG: hypothetical protein ACJAQT_001566 [Akkermansiaceae bacterium]|jgi:hypothetical protein
MLGHSHEWNLRNAGFEAVSRVAMSQYGGSPSRMSEGRRLSIDTEEAGCGQLIYDSRSKACSCFALRFSTGSVNSTCCYVPARLSEL